MNAPRPSGLLLIGALLFAGLLAACTSDRDVRFPHVVHLTTLDCGSPGKPDCLSCSTCHAPSQQGRVAKLPERALCDQCHQDAQAQTTKVLAAQPVRPYGDILFDHASHLAMGGISGQCVVCHGGVVGKGDDNLPPMSACFTCHEHEQQWERAECTPCHHRSDLEKTLPRTFLHHDASFLRDHGSFAVSQEQMCKSCHAQNDCQKCHDATQMISVQQRMPEKFETMQVHPGDFMVRHPIEAASQAASCMRCHEPSSCDACHVERGVSGNAIDARNPHPPGWVGSNYASKDFHGRAARRDLLSCAGCHEAGPATNCIRCHKVGAYGGNPHPGGWRSARGKGETMCSYCHEGGR